MAFKVKTKNRNPINSKQTLDATHNDIITNFQKRKDDLPNIKTRIELINTEVDKLKNIIRENNNNHIFCMNVQKDIWNLEDQKFELQDQIKNIESNYDETQYLLKTGNILKDYYKSEDENMDTFDNLINKKTNNYDKKSVLDWLSHDKLNNIKYNLKNNKQIIELRNNEDNDLDLDNSENIIDEFIEYDNLFNSDRKLSKKYLYQKYMSLVQDNYVVDDSDEECNDGMDVCDNCKVEMLLEQNTGFLICIKCGFQEEVLIDSDKPSYKDPPKEMTSFCYKRINHLNEFLAQFQAKETTEIPEEIYNEILVEIKKERIENMADITSDKLRSILRKIKRNVYYEHRAYIINQLNGLPPPIISPEVEEIIRSMFKEIQVPFDKYCPKKRKNFLSYNYVMYKFFELLELDEYLHCFQLLKSRNKLHQQDQIWKNICKDVKWQFIPSL